MSQRKNPTTQDMMAFNLYEALKQVMCDLERIDAMIPHETSRIPTVACIDEASAIIVARKDDLLGYIQTICRDHMHWGEKLLIKGWEPKHEKSWKMKPRRAQRRFQ